MGAFQMRSCPKCGAEVEDQLDRCPACDADVGARTESFPAVGPEPAPSEEEYGHLAGPVLVVHKGPEVGERFRIDSDRLTVGRDPSRDIFLNDITVSREHAALITFAEEVTIRDADSLNGTYVNGTRVSEAVLRHGDSVQIGRFQMIYLSEGSG